MAKREKAPAKAQTSHSSNNTNTANPTDWSFWLPVLGAALVYAFGLGNAMIGLDDHQSTLENEFVKNFSLANLFQPNFNLGMYAPLTWTGYAICYNLTDMLFGSEEKYREAAFFYHLMGWAVHVYNTTLVVKLLKQLSLRQSTVLVVALLFAIHPIQAEAVSWIAGFSTPLYATFTLLSMQYYLRYAEGDDNRWKQYGLALLMFVLACLAKSAAVCLPLLVVILDWWKTSRIDFKTRLAAYVPFFLVALGFGLLTIYSRNVSGTHVGAPSEYSAVERALLVCFSPLFYIWKLLVPFKLNIYYSYDKVNGQLPIQYYISPLIVAALGGIAIWRRKSAPYLYVGLAFFLANIFFTLPFTSLGTFELCADHYNYLACIGIFYILSEGYHDLVNRFPGYAGLVKVIAQAAIVLVAFLGIRQARIWKDTVTVITNAIDNGYYHKGMMYFGRGVEYGDLKRFDLALKDMTRAIEIDPDMKDAYRLRGSIYGNLGQMDNALSDFQHYVASDPNDAVVWLNIGSIYLAKNQPQKALDVLNKAIEIKPKSYTLYLERAKAYRQLGIQEAAAADEAKAKELGKSQQQQQQQQ